MSTAWMAPVVLRREPWRAVAMRVVGRAIVPGVALWLSGVPKTAWGGEIPWRWLRGIVFLIAVRGLVLWVLAIANVVANRRALLVVMGTGSIERPRSVQERWLKARKEYAIGKTVTVTVDPGQFMSKAEPRVSLSAEGTVRRIALWGTEPADFVAQANTLLAGRGVRLVLAEPAGEAPAA